MPIAVLQDEDRHRSKSAGWIQAALPQGHGYFFVDKATGHYVQVSGDVAIEQLP